MSSSRRFLAVHRALRTVTQLPENTIEADSAKSHLHLEACVDVADQDDVAAWIQDIARPLSKAALQAHVDRPGKVAGGVVGRFPPVEELRTLILPLQNLLHLNSGGVAPSSNSG